MPLGLLPVSSGSARAVAPNVVGCCAPPPWFKAAEGVRAAWPCGDGPFGRTPISSRSGTPAQRNGRKYEAKALSHLQEVLGVDFKPSYWFRYAGDAGIKYCQLDGLLHCEELTAIFEVKTRFTSDAWWQLRKQYEPVIAKAFLLKAIALVIVCKNFDPAAPFPEPVTHLWKLNRQHLSEGLGKISVLQWRP